jgi:hypothetical protein
MPYGRPIDVHSYSTRESRVKVYSVIAVVSVVVAWSLVWLTSRWDWPQWLVSVPSLGGVFALLYGVFDRWLWRLRLVRWLGLVNIADVAGSYEGALISTFKDKTGKQTRRNVTFNIRQTWTQLEVIMSVRGGSSTSRSQSAVASVSNRGSGTHLIYVYHNQVNPAIADPDMSDHEGAADIEITADGTLTGRYFNSRPRAGSISARRKSNN